MNVNSKKRKFDGIKYWLLVSAAVMLAGGAVLVGNRTDAHATDHRIIVGLATTVACETTGWHDSGHPGWSALDLRADTCSNQSGTAVYWQSWHISGSGSQPMYNTPVVHAGACTGMDVKPYANDYGYLGDYTCTHVNVASWGAWTAVANGGWTIRYVGTVVTDEVSGCKGTYWDGPHLHQGGNTNSAPVYRNWSLPSYYGAIISPTGDWSNNWEHKYVW